MAHDGRRRRGRAGRGGALRRSWPVRLYRSARDAVRERFTEVGSSDRAGESAPWTSSTAAAGLLLVSGAAVALAPVAIGELVTASSRGEARSGILTSAPAPPPPPLPAVPGPVDAAGVPSAPGGTTRATVDDRPAGAPAGLRVHRMSGQQYRARPLAEDDDADRSRDSDDREDDDRGDDDDRDDRDDRDDDEDDRRGGSDDSSESSGTAGGESDQVERDREKAEREREAVEAERERIESSR